MPPPLQPTKAASIWFFAWAEAILHDETLAEFRANDRSGLDIQDLVR